MSERREMPAREKMDLRIRRTRGAIREAFVALMKKKEYAAITVTDISEQADINRKTFYAHYETKEQLLAQLIEEMFCDLMDTLMYPKTGTCGDREADLKRDLTVFFQKVNVYRERIDILITPQTSQLAFAIADDVIRSQLEIIGLPAEVPGLIHREIYVSRIKSFLLTSIDWWMEQDSYTPEEAAAAYGGMMRLSLSDVFGY